MTTKAKASALNNAHRVAMLIRCGYSPTTAKAAIKVAEEQGRVLARDWVTAATVYRAQMLRGAR